MTQSWVSQIVSSLDSIIKILTQFGLESYALKVCISLKIYVNITIFLVWVFGKICADIFRPKCFNTLRPQCVDSSSKQHKQWEYRDISVQKIMHEKLV